MLKYIVLFIWDIKLKFELIRCICFYWRNWIYMRDDLVFVNFFYFYDIFLNRFLVRDKLIVFVIMVICYEIEDGCY